MKLRVAVAIIIVLTFAIRPTLICGFETDQYNLPPVPLTDIGDEFSAYIAENIVEAVNKVNAEIALYQACLGGGKHCANAKLRPERLAYLRSESAIADAVYERLGSGNLFVTKTGKWFKKHKFAEKPDRYKISYLRSLYVFAPANYLTISPTIKMYGVEFGYDKIEHILQQGHKYYAIKTRALAKGLAGAAAQNQAVAWGKKSERTFFGYWVSGVYSNADLFANFAGLRFYEGLTRAVEVGGNARPAVAYLKDGLWQIDPEAIANKNLLKPFINEGLNEAYNPSVYASHIFPTVRRVVRKQACPEWRKLLPDATKADLALRSATHEKWNGLDYGFKKGSRMVTIGEACFTDQPPSSSTTSDSAS